MSVFQIFLQSIEKIVRLDEADRNAMQPLLEFKEYSKDEHLTRQGETENFLYFIIDGCIRNYSIHEGEDYSVDFYFSGSFTTSYMSFLLREPSTVSVQAITPSRILRIHYNDVQRLYSEFKNIETLGRIITERSYIRRTKREFSFITQSAKERYLALLSQNKDLVQLIPQKYLASYLGIKAESLSRIRKNLKEM
jgi:CRP/FNR family transcriptional regulator, anaerobic regulatory protein